MIIVMIRTFLLYGLVLFSMRFMGKSELSKMSPFQLVIVFLIAELAAIPIDNTAASLIHGITAIATLTFLQVSLSYLSIKSENFKNFISGKPSILIEDGHLNLKELKRLRITNTDLMEQLRLENCPSISDVQYAIMESNGQLTVIPKAKVRPVTPQDLKLTVLEEALPVILISDGTLYKRNLYMAGMNEDLFHQKLKKAGIEMTSIFLAFRDSQKKIHIYLKETSDGALAKEVKL